MGFEGQRLFAAKLVAVVAPVFGLALLAGAPSATPQRLVLDAAVLSHEASDPLRGCVYFDDGAGFSDAKRRCFSYARAPGRRSYHVSLPSTPIRALRFDPLEYSGEVLLSRVSLDDPAAWQLDLDKVELTSRSLRLARTDGGLLLRSEGADPHVILAHDLVLPAAGYERSVVGGPWMLFLALALVTLVARSGSLTELTRRWLAGVAAGAIAATAVPPILERYFTSTVVSLEIAVMRRGAHGFNACFYADFGNGFSFEVPSCFEYDRFPLESFHEYEIPLQPGVVHGLRFDPSDGEGEVRVRSAHAMRRGVKVPLDRWGLTHGVELSLASGNRDVLVARMTGLDPYWILEDDIDEAFSWNHEYALRRSRAWCSAATLGVGLVALVLMWRERRLQWLAQDRGPLAVRLNPDSVAWATLAIAAAVVIVVKTLAGPVSWMRFGRETPLSTLLLAPAPDLAILLAVAALLAALRVVDRAGGVLEVRLVVGAIRLAVALVLAILAIAYLLFGYVFWEWGAFLEREHFRMLLHSPAPRSIAYYLTRPTAMVFVVVGALILGSMSFLLRRLHRSPLSPRARRALVCLFVAWAALGIGPLRNPKAYDDAVGSPLELALHNDLDYAKYEPQPDLAAVSALPPPAPRPIAAEYENLRGAARGRDVVVVVLESVRRASVSLYGYGRPTMPHLGEMAKRALVFQNAYAQQPRSSKALDSLLLGFADPRADPFVWEPWRIAGTPNLLGRLADVDYRIYFGITWEKEWENFSDFIAALAGPALDRATGLLELDADDRPEKPVGDDERLVDDFLRWYEGARAPTFALLWLSAGHHPYIAPHRPFEESSEIDAYDNCLASADRALARLTAGTERIGKQPLVLVLGDHGEAFGEHLGDIVHGVYLYDQTIRIPCVLYDPEIFKERHDVDAPFSIKDTGATLLYLLGLDSTLGQSEVVFAKTAQDPIFLSTVVGDYKLGVISNGEKFVWLPTRDLGFLYDLAADPEERANLVPSRPAGEIQAWKERLRVWYGSQIAYVDERFPRPKGWARASGEVPRTRRWGRF